MKLDNNQLLKLAEWVSLKETWVNFEDDDRPVANYALLDNDLKSIDGYKIRESDGWEYADTYFDYFFYTSNLINEAERSSAGIHVSLSRFGPIGIYCKGSKTYHECGVSISRPSLETLYQIPDQTFLALELEIISCFKKHNIYMPSQYELERLISFDLPALFEREANLDTSRAFGIIINDLY